MAIHRIRLWFRRWWGRNRVTLAGGCAVVILAVIFTVHYWEHEEGRAEGRGVQDPVFRSLEPPLVDLTLLRKAKAEGALCLDGSLPGYHLLRGEGSGSDKWVLHLEGGGWCNNAESCASRGRTALGSSMYMEAMHFVGILSPYPSQNPDFFNWNKVKVRYCDGASFAGDVESEDQSGLKLFFRGQHVWEAIIDQLLSEGLAKAKQAFLTGCSAGGLATFIHCDNFRNRLPKDATVKCLADAGFFLDEKDISGKETVRSFFNEVVHLQGVAKSLPNDCVTAIEPPQCFFPHELIKRINTPLFILNPAYDFWQIQHILAPLESDPGGQWRRCTMNIRYCNSNQIEILHGFRKSLLDSLNKFQRNKKGGMFINSCFVHCQTMSNITWHSPTSPRLSNKTIAEAVGDWYFERGVVMEIDCPYPCNPTCFNLEFI
ncbi:pectin acetylesterase 5 isoform X1 [Dendrobium catenatum]|uniref:Pectin acetylesterase n=1 Tax=Dendrobium catenatum TaxID=906689 RepID=A0A2I0X5F5_9ASPA|nr:pectin acetylesterase 5 isoform X1 [Dendrobium catenatum]XP_020704897.1 pectin acetylesterase 5 isoform X1 [Dendrobium catenatum]XP_020704898.1 pectin acetylesterase 5 isoform X1 [Dendrobium catenatum]XP_028549375.1 pectin acetylesterase 5 isoform X1 [Dendrobium catenatum]PKU83136.1 hypothetical protein MA16_Dca007794 [Dendrobium catenatum]